MGYGPDLSRLSVQKYRAMLKNKDLLPGRRPLLEDIDEHFRSIASRGIGNVAELQQALSTSKKRSALAAATGIPDAYLVLLRREIGGLVPKAVPIKDLVDMDAGTGQRLAAAGIRTSADLYGAHQSGRLSALASGQAQELFAQCDLVRVNGIGPLAARIFIAAGYDSCQAVADADAASLLERLAAANEEGGFYAGSLGSERDMQYCIDSARFLVDFAA